NGVLVREVWTNQIKATGEKGPGAVQYDTYKGGGGQVEIVDEAGNRIGELSRGMDAGWPPFDLMWDAGYCNCKPHPDADSCRADLESHSYLFACFHYVYEVVYQRTF
ncbi:MAG: hypothetical protein GX605_09460, partial [Chloroflexi bacterium]|nr:hypothetical protein [Chloroflexota bacterium]